MPKKEELEEEEEEEDTEPTGSNLDRGLEIDALTILKQLPCRQSFIPNPAELMVEFAIRFKGPVSFSLVIFHQSEI